MERQRSFGVKSTTFLVFSLIISSSLIFLTSFFFLVIKSTPSFNLIQFKETETPLSSSSSSPLNPSSAAHSPAAGFNGDLISSSEVKSSISVSADSNFSSAQRVLEIAEFPRKENGSTSASKELLLLGENSKGNNGTWLNPKLSEVVSGIEERPHRDLNVSGASSDKAKLPRKERIEEKRRIEGGCDLTDGKWVFDDEIENYYPLYRNTSCPFIDEGFNCEANGRLDKDYMKWRWQPRQCHLPRFNATKMLELIAGKRLVFAGDSLNRNQWESMLCLLMGAVKDPRKVYETRGRRITKERGNYSFKFVDYKCTVEYYATHFLVHESKARIGKKRLQTLRIDTIDKGSSRWRGADILVFNTAHWWSHHKTKAGINYYQEKDQVHPRLDVSVAFRRALITWASWVDKYINPRKTQVFFRSSAPSHFSGGQWNTGGHCREASQPTNATPGVIDSEKNTIAEEVLRQMKTPVTFLNITGLSSYRIDGHPSIYGKSVTSGAEDCSHWCLPGVPDSWNQMLFYHLLLNVKK